MSAIIISVSEAGLTPCEVNSRSHLTKNKPYKGNLQHCL